MFPPSSIGFRLSIRGALFVSLTLAPPLADRGEAQLPLNDPALVNVETAGNQRVPRAGMRDDGRFTVVWTSGASGAEEILLRTYQSDGTPFNPGPLNQFTAGTQSAATISMNANGDFVAAWSSLLQVPSSERDLFGRHSSNNGSVLGNELQVNVDAEHDTNNLALARADDDSFVAAWRDGEDLSLVYGRKFGADGTPATGDLILNQGSSSIVLTATDVAAAPDGSFVAVWAAPDLSGLGIFGRRFDAAGAPLTDDFRVNLDEADDQSFAQIAMDARGAFAVIWTQGAIGGQLEMRLFHPDGEPRTGDLPVNDVVTGTRVQNRLDVAPDGAIFVAMGGTSMDADGGIAVREFGKGGQPLGGQFLVNVATPGIQSQPDIAVGERLFAVVWEDQEGTSGANFDIFVRRYLRRVVFTDDFESEDLFYWSSSAP